MNAVLEKQQLPAVGSAFAGGFLAGRINIDGAPFALIVAPKAEGEHKDTPWGKLKRVAGALSFFDGFANTAAMVDAGSKLAAWARGLKIGGHDDWYVPSRDELELCYRNLKPTKEENYCYRGDNPSSIPVGYAYMPDAPAQTPIEAFKEGGAEAFDDSWYWSSTQFAGDGGYAWTQSFGYGNQLGDLKVNGCRCRAVRRVAI